MRKLFILLALVPFLVNGQTPGPLVDLSEYHDDNRILEMTDLNFTNITEGGYTLPLLKADSIDVRALMADTATIPLLKSDSAVIVVLDYSPPHGSMAFADSAAVIPLAVNVWSKVTNGNNDLFTIIDADDLTFDGDTITITIAGDYVIWWSLSFNGGPSDVYHAAVYKNTTITPFEMHRKTANNDTGNMVSTVI